MTIQITVRLPDDLVAFVDEQIRTGQSASRADAVAAALTRDRRRRIAQHDAAIYRQHVSEPDDLDKLAEFAAVQPLDLD